MYTKASSEGSLFRALRARVGLIAGPVLYGVTVTGEIAISGAARFCLVYAAAWVAGLFVGLPLRAEQLALLGAFGPVAWSLSALVYPGTGWLWRRRRGVRRAADGEVQKIRAALGMLGLDPDVIDALCRRIRIFDSALPAAVVWGRAVVLTRGMVECEGLPGPLGHDLFHVFSSDGRLSVALVRFGFWGDPMGLPDEALEPGEGVAVVLIWSVLRVLVALAGCRPTRWLLSPLWASYWRAREYRADAYAVSLGVGEDLIAHLEEFEQVLDRPQSGLLRGSYEHPPVALRISRLRKLLDAVEE